MFSIAFVLNHFRLHAKLGQDTWLDKTGQWSIEVQVSSPALRLLVLLAVTTDSRKLCSIFRTVLDSGFFLRFKTRYFRLGLYFRYYKVRQIFYSHHASQKKKEDINTRISHNSSCFSTQKYVAPFPPSPPPANGERGFRSFNFKRLFACDKVIWPWPWGS